MRKFWGLVLILVVALAAPASAHKGKRHHHHHHRAHRAAAETYIPSEAEAATLPCLRPWLEEATGCVVAEWPTTPAEEAEELQPEEETFMTMAEYEALTQLPGA